MDELSKKVYNRITSFANYSKMNGIEREWILKCIKEGLIEAQNNLKQLRNNTKRK